MHQTPFLAMKNASRPTTDYNVLRISTMTLAISKPVTNAQGRRAATKNDQWPNIRKSG
jgi:hypothetical protein